jgi:hypothetical protein
LTKVTRSLDPGQEIDENYSREWKRLFSKATKTVFASGEEFADDMKGWALVLVKGERCSPQTIVTRCTLYKQYTTAEALETAADSYGGLTDRCMP